MWFTNIYESTNDGKTATLEITFEISELTTQPAPLFNRVLFYGRSDLLQGRCLLQETYFCTVYEYARNVDVSKGYWNPNRKLGVPRIFRDNQGLILRKNMSCIVMYLEFSGIIYLLLTEFGFRTISYGPSFFPIDLWPKREARWP